MKALHVIAFLLVVIGGINWGLIGAGGWNVVEMVVGAGTVAKVIYVLVGLSALVLVATHKRDCRDCVASAPVTPTM